MVLLSVRFEIARTYVVAIGTCGERHTSIKSLFYAWLDLVSDSSANMHGRGTDGHDHGPAKVIVSFRCNIYILLAVCCAMMSF